MYARDATAKITYTGTTFQVPFYEGDRLLSYEEIMRVINANLPDNRPIMIWAYVKRDNTPPWAMYSEPRQMTRFNYHLIFLYLGLHIEEDNIIPQAMSNYFSTLPSVALSSKKNEYYKCETCGNIHFL